MPETFLELKYTDQSGEMKYIEIQRKKTKLTLLERYVEFLTWIRNVNFPPE